MLDAHLAARARRVDELVTADRDADVRRAAAPRCEKNTRSPGCRLIVGDRPALPVLLGNGAREPHPVLVRRRRPRSRCSRSPTGRCRRYGRGRPASASAVLDDRIDRPVSRGRWLAADRRRRSGRRAGSRPREGGRDGPRGGAARQGAAGRTRECQHASSLKYRRAIGRDWVDPIGLGSESN